LQAVQLLGVDLVRSLVLATGAFAMQQRPELARICEELQLHSVQIAHVASSIADPASRRDTMTAGLLHDIGWLVYLHCAPRSSPCPIDRRFASATSEPEDDGLHASLGAYLLALWGLPLDVIEAVATHHSPVAIAGHGDASVSAIANNVRRAELGLRRALAEKAPSLRERAIALATTL
jgi:HD-like signal output (HDOD) protein